jgi:hypothetical protein
MRSNPLASSPALFDTISHHSTDSPLTGHNTHHPHIPTNHPMTDSPPHSFITLLQTQKLIRIAPHHLPQTPHHPQSGKCISPSQNPGSALRSLFAGQGKCRVGALLYFALSTLMTQLPCCFEGGPGAGRSRSRIAPLFLAWRRHMVGGVRAEHWWVRGGFGVVTTFLLVGTSTFYIQISPLLSPSWGTGWVMSGGGGSLVTAMPLVGTLGLGHHCSG